MLGEGSIADASVLGAAFFEEADTRAARRFLIESSRLIAPSLLMFEIASIAAKKTWKGLVTPEVCERAIGDTPTLVLLVAPTVELTVAAYRYASDHKISAYDASYLALADATGLKVVTLDEKLVARAGACGLGHLVRSLSSTGLGYD